jgi:signal transduction histidine kinase
MSRVPTVRPISLGWIVPVISAVILATVVTGFGTIAYRAVRVSTLNAAAERLATVVQVFAQPAVIQPPWIHEGEVVAESPAVIDVVRSNGQRVSDSARARVASLTPDTGQTLATDIRGLSGNVLFSITSPIVDSLARSDTNANALPKGVREGVEAGASATHSPVRLNRSYPDSVAQSELYLSGPHVTIERSIPIHDGGRLVGHIVQVRKVVTSQNALRQLNSLIGKDARLVVGNRDGSLWSDLTKAIKHPNPSSQSTTYESDGRRWLSATGPAPTGPWLLGVELPEDIVLAPVYALRWRLFWIGAVIVVLAVMVTERLSRRLTIPLLRLTTAAEGIAAGRRTTPLIDTERTDEIGRLSRAFATMADSIRTSQDTLEMEIGDRTLELQTALTQLRDAQGELVRQERLATLGHLSGSIAHELRNPLGVMMNALYYLESVLSDAPPKVRDHLGKLRSQVRLSESIITGLLSVTRTGPPQLSTVSVPEIVDEHLSRVSIPSSIRVDLDIPPDLPELLVDPIQVGQILTNLFINAVQAMEGKDGVMTVRARAAGDRVRIEVADTGPGVRAEDRERIFEPLFTTKARGIGLGLSISRSLARANSGELNLSSPHGKGAVMTLELPVAVQSNATVSAIVDNTTRSGV